MKIFLDTREQKTRELFSRAFPLEYCEKKLRIGDLAADWFDRLIMVEIKIGADMLNISHLRDQISRMSEDRWRGWEKHLILTRETLTEGELLKVVKIVNGQCFMAGIYLHIRDFYENDLISTILEILSGKYTRLNRYIELPSSKLPLAVRMLASVPGITVQRAEQIVSEIKKTGYNAGLADLTRAILIEDEIGQCVLDRVFGLNKNGSRKKIVEKIRERLKTGT